MPIPATTFQHRSVQCMGCGTRYKTLDALSGHDCKDAPSYMSIEALKALAHFNVRNGQEARTLLEMWARRDELTIQDVAYVVTEALK